MIILSVGGRQLQTGSYNCTNTACSCPPRLPSDHHERLAGDHVQGSFPPALADIGPQCAFRASSRRSSDKRFTFMYDPFFMNSMFSLSVPFLFPMRPVCLVPRRILTPSPQTTHGAACGRPRPLLVSKNHKIVKHFSRIVPMQISWMGIWVSARGVDSINKSRATWKITRREPSSSCCSLPSLRFPLLLLCPFDDLCRLSSAIKSMSCNRSRLIELRT